MACIEFQNLMGEISQFQKTTFPGSNAVSKLHHLSSEVDELIVEMVNVDHDNEKVRMEFADCFLLLIGAAVKVGMNGDMVFQAIRDKLEINKKRKWGKPDELGVVSHIEE